MTRPPPAGRADAVRRRLIADVARADAAVARERAAVARLTVLLAARVAVLSPPAPVG